jgi:hypothetical protein
VEYNYIDGFWRLLQFVQTAIGSRLVRRRQQPETLIQRAVFIRARGVRGLVAIHPPLAGYRRPIEAKILHGIGTTAGTPDLLAWHDGKAYAMEIKNTTGRTSPAQLEMLNRLSKAGVFTAIAHGLDGGSPSWKTGDCCGGRSNDQQ